MANAIDLVKVIASVGVLQLRNMIVTPYLVYKPFQDTICQVGDTIKIPRPYSFQSNAMDPTVGVTAQDITDNMIEMKVDQWQEVTVKMNDLEATVQNRINLKKVVGDMIIPIVEKIEVSVINQLTYNTSRAGSVGGVANAYLNPDKIVDIRTAQMLNKVPLTDRNNLFGLLSAKDEGALLKEEKFTNGQWTPDGGQALKNAMLAQRYGYSYFPSQLTSRPTIVDSSGLVNNGAGYAAGVSTLVVDSFSAAPPEGSIVTFANHSTPYTVDAGSTTTSLKLKNALSAAVVDNEAITVLDVNQNVFFHRNACAFAPVPLSSSDGNYPGSIIGVATDPVSGLSVRAEYYRDPNKKTNFLTLDALWGVKMLEEKLAYKYYTQS